MPAAGLEEFAVQGFGREDLRRGAMDPAALLQPRSEEAPSGDNMEYDPVFIEMEAAAQPGREVQLGDEIKRLRRYCSIRTRHRCSGEIQNNSARSVSAG